MATRSKAYPPLLLLRALPVLVPLWQADVP